MQTWVFDVTFTPAGRRQVTARTEEGAARCALAAERLTGNKTRGLRVLTVARNRPIGSGADEAQAAEAIGPTVDIRQGYHCPNCGAQAGYPCRNYRGHRKPTCTARGALEAQTDYRPVQPELF